MLLKVIGDEAFSHLARATDRKTGSLKKKIKFLLWLLLMSFCGHLLMLSHGTFANACSHTKGEVYISKIKKKKRFGWCRATKYYILPLIHGRVEECRRSLTNKKMAICPDAERIAKQVNKTR